MAARMAASKAEWKVGNSVVSLVECSVVCLAALSVASKVENSVDPKAEKMVVK